MFEEGDWNDDVEARALTDRIFHTHGLHARRATPSAHSKKKRQKLLETLRALTAAGRPGGELGPEAGVKGTGVSVVKGAGVSRAGVRKRKGGIGLCSDRSAALRCRMQQRLQSARFRYINEQLYTSSSAAASCMFARDSNAFLLYHQGFNMQLQSWPHNPVNTIISYIKNRPRSAVVADFGCGDCKIASSVANTVHSFDLAALNHRVTVCDMAKVPLADESVDIAVFCLSLMGTNLADFLMEANRVLRVGGVLKIAEVASRFQDVRSFIGAVGSLGFKLLSKDTGSRYFYLFDFGKTRRPREGKLTALELKPCLYKRR
ncbi:ribosomal RNA-processing protein 8 [Rhinoraja longicauda]